MFGNAGRRWCGSDAKDLVFDVESRRRLQDGINKVVDAVGATLGPRGMVCHGASGVSEWGVCCGAQLQPPELWRVDDGNSMSGSAVFWRETQHGLPVAWVRVFLVVKDECLLQFMFVRSEARME